MQNLRVLKKPVTIRGVRVAANTVVPKSDFPSENYWQPLVAEGRLEETDDPVGAAKKKEASD